jgi:diaminopimelate decarboxylase
MTPDEVVATARALKREGVRLETVHFHLRTNVASASIYERALAHMAEVCRSARLAPRYIDCGGGFPPDHVLTREDRAVAAEFNVAEMARVYERALKQFPSAKEIWLENGRWLSARSGVLVVKILDVKERKGIRHLICDGGRTLNALISNWESHELVPLPYRQGASCLTTVVGPTCMAFDQLARRPLPRRLRAGDHLLWLEAGAYHLSWETRFSHGLAAVFWHDGRQTRRVRASEKFSTWWGQWK